MKQLFYSLLALFLCGQVVAQNVVTVTDADLANGTYNWTSDNIYMLDGFVFLEEGGTLNIEAGTVIKGKETPTTNDNASALIITRGAQIFANGVEGSPIIFTTELDDTTDPTDLSTTDRGLWGGLIVLGKAVIANTTAETRVEGIPEGEARALFGGDDDTDNSGVLRYVSIRHGGAELSPGDEINGLTLGAVGSGTTIEHVEVIANQDDGIEFFGGTVAVKFASVAYCGDDAFDWDLGYRGKGQFWFAMVGEDDGDNGGELDGAKPDDGEPTSAPTVYNATFVGAGCNSTASNATGLLFRDGTAGTFVNGIVTGFVHGVEVEDRASGLDSRQRMENGELTIANNVWFGICNGNELNAGDNGLIRATGDAEDATAQFLIDHLAGNGNTIEDPQLANMSREAGQFDPRPAFGGPAYTSVADLPADDDFFQIANYKGAFGGSIWLRNWTAIDEYGLLPAAGEVVTIKDEDLVAGETYQWTNDKCYLLDGFVFLEEGGTLKIQEGTVIKGKETPSTNDNASALIITRGAEILATGNQYQPIIFTSELDDVDDPADLTETDRGLWGGLIILGNAVIANTTAETRVEGIPEGEPRALFGGTDDNDYSGVLRYVSIRHGGAELAPGDEINGLTLGAVGSATTIEHVEVIANQDDGIEFFGGTVGVKFATVAFCGDDCFDWDLGYRGKGQFWFALTGEDDGDNGGELDGAKPDDGEPTSNPTVYNATFVGAGCNSTASNATGLLFRDGTAGTFTNGIVMMYNHGIEVEDRASGLDSRQRMENGELTIANNLWFGFCNGDELNAGDNGLIRATGDAEDAAAQFLISHLATNGNQVTDPLLNGISRTADKGLDPRPAFGGPAYGDVADLPNDAFFQIANYKGAFGTNIWLKNWTALDEYGLVADPIIGGACTEEVVIVDGSLSAGETYNWTSDKCYLLDGFVFLEEGATLNIQAGTVIKGKETPSTNDNASALIVARGATINAVGTAEAPIIFTTELDDTTDPDDLTLNDRGLWGGLIILGNAVIANTTAETRVEGIPEGEPRALFGGTNDADNSGILQYVSIRHGGAELAPGDEINGLTLGAVGSGTTLEHIEVLANQDDGIEFFGGTVNLKYAAVAFCGDDSFDWDLGYRGKGQFWLSLTGEDDGDNGGELDGAKPDDGEPTSNPTVYNATFIGAGCNSTASNATGLLFRDGTAGTFNNGIVMMFNHGIEVEDRASGLDSRQRMENGEMSIANNLWFGFCNGDELNAGDNGLVRATGDAEDAAAQFLIDHLAANGNQVTDPGIAVSRTNDGGFNPLPGEVAYANQDVPTAMYPEGDAFFTQVCFRGAFGDDKVWAQGWTALAEYGLLNSELAYGEYDDTDECFVSVEDIILEQNGYTLSQNTPNPFGATTQIAFTLPTKDVVSLNVYDMTGRAISTVINTTSMAAGTYTVDFDANALPNGIYYYNLTTSKVSLTKEMVIYRK